MNNRLLKNGDCRITNDNAAHCKGGGKPAIDIVKAPSLTDTLVAHSAGTVDQIQTGYKNAKGSTGMASYGNMVRICHGKNNKGQTVHTRLAHLAAVYVKVGDKVERGQNIGFMGNTGNSYGAHEHFEVIVDGKRVDPTPYLNAPLPGFEFEKESEELTMSQFEQIMAEIKGIKEALPTHYRYTKDIPVYYRSVVQLALDKKIISGRAADNLDISEDMCRQLVYMHNCKMF